MTKVFQGFRRNQGLLLSGAVAYYTLLSLIPMLIIMLVVFSHFTEEWELLQTISRNLELVVPLYAGFLTEQVRLFLGHRHVIGVVGISVMLLFSSLAFTVLENAMSVIFFHRVRIKRRHFLVSAIIPYIYMALLGSCIVLVSVIAGILNTLEKEEVMIFGTHLTMLGTARVGIYALGIIGEVLLLTSFYLVMPVGRITFRHALLGGVTATVLWEITRHVLVWYYSKLSVVNLIYGSLATTVVALLGIEAAAIILLLGAQVIAEFERQNSGIKEDDDSGFRTS